MKTATMESPTANQKPVDASRAETTESVWKPLYLALLSLVPFAIWCILIARRLFQLAQGISKEEAKQPAVA